MYRKDIEMTPKQAKFLSIWLKTGNGTESALQAYNVKDRNSAKNMASESLARLSLTMRDFCEANGISFRQLFDKNRELFEAKKTFSSHTEPDKQVPDYQIQDKALERFERWLGVKAEVPNITQNNILVMPSEIINKYALQTNSNADDDH